jgi:hypothetical protein
MYVHFKLKVKKMFMHNDLDIPNVEDEKFETLGDLNLSDLKKYEHILKSKQTQREIQYYET